MRDACYCNAPWPSVFNESRPIARKQHRCSECGGYINKGERYERFFGVWEGDAMTFKTCVACLSLRDFFTVHADCYCIEYGGLWETARDNIDYIDWQPGMKFAAWRTLVEAQNDRCREPKGDR